jgi:hypothetical protein
VIVDHKQFGPRAQVAGRITLTSKVAAIAFQLGVLQQSIHLRKERFENIEETKSFRGLQKQPEGTIFLHGSALALAPTVAQPKTFENLL